MAEVRDVFVTEVSLKSLVLGVYTPRISVDMRYVDELSEDMRVNGQYKPIICVLHPENPDKCIVVDGEYRVRAARKLGWDTIRAELRKLSEEEAYRLALAINEMHGKRLNPVEEAMHIQKMMEKFCYTEAEVASRLRKSQQWVSERLKLIRKAAPEVKEAVTTRVVKPTHVREIAKLPEEEQKEVLKEVIEHKLPTRTTEALAEALKVAETEEERRKVLEVIPKLDSKKAKALAEILKETEPEKRLEMLSKPIEAYSRIFETPEQLKRAVEMSPSAAVIESFECPCGCGYRLLVNWVDQRAEWSKSD